MSVEEFNKVWEQIQKLLPNARLIEGRNDEIIIGTGEYL